MIAITLSKFKMKIRVQSKLVPISVNTPTRRHQHATIVINDNTLVIFAGFRVGACTSTEFHELNINSQIWTPKDRLSFSTFEKHIYICQIFYYDRKLYVIEIKEKYYVLQDGKWKPKSPTNIPRKELIIGDDDCGLLYKQCVLYFDNFDIYSIDLIKCSWEKIKTFGGKTTKQTCNNYSHYSWCLDAEFNRCLLFGGTLHTEMMSTKLNDAWFYDCLSIT